LPHSATLFPYTTLFRSIAELFFHHFGFAVDELQRPFGAADDAFTAAVAEVFVDFDNLALHVMLLFLTCWAQYAGNGKRFLDRSQDRKSTRLNSSHVKIS